MISVANLNTKATVLVSEVSNSISKWSYLLSALELVENIERLIVKKIDKDRRIHMLVKLVNQCTVCNETVSYCYR